MYGRPAGDFPGRTLAEALPPLDAGRAEAALRQVLGDGVPAVETFAAGSLPAGAGAPSRVFHWFPVRDEAGCVTGAGLIVAGLIPSPDEEALRRSEERYRALVQGGASV